MDALIKESLERVNTAVNNINWEVLEEGKKGGRLDIQEANELKFGLRKAIRSVDVLKSALKSMPFQ